MERTTAQMTVASMLGLVAAVALHLWLFRLGALWGIVGLTISKHLLVAYLCRMLGVDRPASDPQVPHPGIATEFPPP